MPSDQASQSWNNFLTAVGWFLFATALFAIAYCQAPLFYSNQYQYFLHGLAQGGMGNLNEDWLANTKDPTPIFTFLVAQTHQHFYQWVFYGYYALLMGVYFVSLVGLYSLLADKQSTPRLRWSFIAIFLLLHSALLRYVSVRLFGADYPWYFQAGLAGQYLLGPVFQPSNFGVLLVLSVCLFTAEMPLLAVVCSSMGGVLHSTYLLPAAILTISYLCVLGYRREWSRVCLVGGVALTIVLPIVIYNYMSFRPSSPETFDKAQEILVHFRIPHHAIPRLWCDEIAVGQMLWVLLAVILVWGRPLSAVLLISSLLGGALTVLQLATQNNTLALIFPWRISVVLVPIATTIILTRSVIGLGSLFGGASEETRRWCDLVTGGVIGTVLLAGGLIAWERLAFQSRPEERALLEHVRKTKKPGEVYFLPVQVPNLKPKIRGSWKSDFKPLKTVTSDMRFLPVDLQSFRLATGAPIYVDFKSIPYADQDVVAWRERIARTKKVTENLKEEPIDPHLPELREQGITHLVMPIAAQISSPEVEQVYEDPFYRIYAFVKE